MRKNTFLKDRTEKIESLYRFNVARFPEASAFSECGLLSSLKHKTYSIQGLPVVVKIPVYEGGNLLERAAVEFCETGTGLRTERVCVIDDLVGER